MGVRECTGQRTGLGRLVFSAKHCYLARRANPHHVVCRALFIVLEFPGRQREPASLIQYSLPGGWGFDRQAELWGKWKFRWVNVPPSDFQSLTKTGIFCLVLVTENMQLAKIFWSATLTLLNRAHVMLESVELQKGRYYRFVLGGQVRVSGDFTVHFNLPS